MLTVITVMLTSFLHKNCGELRTVTLK